ncbi:MAG: hypothetical protein RIR68_3196, partial [Pseudomonadota bacterium]
MSPEACAIDPMRSLTPSTNPLVGALVVAESKVMATFWTRHARVLFRHLWVVLVFLGLWVGSENAWASPTVGERFSDSILTERGYQIPLPPGQWEATATKTEIELKAVVLANKDKQAKIPFMVIRYSTATKTRHWAEACNLMVENFFWQSRHGTQANQNFQICQSAYLDRLPVAGDPTRSKVVWDRLYDGFSAADQNIKNEMMLRTDLSVRLFRNDFVSVILYLRHSISGEDLNAVRTAILEKNQNNPWAKEFIDWTALYIDKLNSSVIDKRYQSMVAFDPPVLLAGQTPGAKEPVSSVSNTVASTFLATASTDKQNVEAAPAKPNADLSWSLPFESTAKPNADLSWSLPFESKERFLEVYDGFEGSPFLPLKTMPDPTVAVHAPGDGVVLYSGRFNNQQETGFVIRHQDKYISVISSSSLIVVGSHLFFRQAGDQVSAKDKIGELKGYAPGVPVPLWWEVYAIDDARFSALGALTSLLGANTGKADGSNFATVDDLIRSIRKFPELNTKALLGLGVIRLEEAEKGSLAKPEIVLEGTHVGSLNGGGTSSGIQNKPNKTLLSPGRSFLASPGLFNVQLTTGLFFRETERTSLEVKAGDVTRLLIYPSAVGVGRFRGSLSEGQGLSLESAAKVQPAEGVKVLAQSPAAVQVSSAAMAWPNSERAEQDRRAAEQLQLQLQQRLQAEEEARKKAQQELELIAQNAQKAQAERETALAQAQRAQEEAQQLLKKEQQAREFSEQKTRQEQAERASLAAEVDRLRAELAQAQQTRPPANMAYRKAFVVGIDSYQHISKLLTAREDARSMASALGGAGFAVSLHLDLGEKDLRAAWRRFTEQVEGGDEVAVFFAGHGVQVGGLNYLIPADVAGESERQLRDDSIPLQRILDDMSERKAKLTLAVIDACRDNPFRMAGRNAGASSRGLAPTTAATGQMVIFSAGAGQKALDNLGPSDKTRNGVFTRVFVQELKQRGLSIDALARRTRSEVVKLARSIGHEQVPAIY